MSLEDRELLEHESLEENPELLEQLYRASVKVNEWLQRELSKVTLNRDIAREKLKVKAHDGSPTRFISILAVDSTWSIPHLELVMGSIAVIVSGYVIVAPQGLGSHGISYVALRMSSGDVEDRFTLSLELSARVKEYLTAYKQLEGDVDLVMLDGPLYHLMIPEFYTPHRGDVLQDSRRAAGFKLASIASRALLDLLVKADKLGVPVVGVVKRVTSRLLLSKLRDVRELVEILERFNDKLVASLILRPGEYIVVDNMLESLREYLELKSDKGRYQRLLRVINYCLEAPEDSLERSLCKRIEKTAMVFYRHKGNTVAPQATRLDVYPASYVDEIVSYAIENSTENNVPAPIDYVDRYVRLESITMRRLHQLLKSHHVSWEVEIAHNLTNPQKQYIYKGYF